MAETIKKFLDYEGLKTYNTNIKKYAKDQASGVETTIRGEFKVKDVDTTVNDKVSLTLNAVTGKVGVTVDAAVVKDSEYSIVKANATNSAAAWTKFLEGTTDLYPNNVTPGLKDLATTANVTSAIATAKLEAITAAGNLDTTLKNEITTAYQGADTTLKNTLIGADGDASTKDTIWGAKKYADEKAGAALTAANNAQTAAEEAQSTADTAKDNADAAQLAADAAQGTANNAVASINELKTNTIPGIKTDLEGKITANTDLINSTKDELIGGSTDTKESNSIKGAKLYAKDLADDLSTRINSIVAGGVAFKGVVSELPSAPKNGDLIIVGKEGGITVGSGVTYKKDYEYIYSEGAWYELGDSDKNAKAIADVEAKANANATAIQNIDTAYKAADSNLSSTIDTVSKAAVKKITGGKSSYVTVTAGTKDETGNVTLTVSDSIAATFDTISNVNSKISAAKSDVKSKLIGAEGNASTDDTIWGAKAYADTLVGGLKSSLVAITAGEINALFA